MSGVIYFVRSGNDGPVKIGYTTSLKQRMAGLQTGHPHRLTLIGTVPGDKYDERTAQTSLIADHLNGEWFNPSTDVLDAVGAWVSNGRVTSPAIGHKLGVRTRRGAHEYLEAVREALDAEASARAAVRTAVLAAHKHGASIRALAEFTGMSTNTIMRWKKDVT